MRSLRSLIAALVSCGVCAALLFVAQPEGGDSASADTLQARGELRWCRGNIHTHSLWSDGDDYPEMIALWYRERGYDFLCYTDHNQIQAGERWTDPEMNKGGLTAYEKLKERFPADWIEERTVDGRREVRLKTFAEISAELSEPGKFLLIQGEEISDKFGKAPIHLNATNVQELLPPMGGESVYDVMQNNVNAAVAQRERTGKPVLIHLNHPNFGYAITAEDLMRVRGENFFEVYNGHPGVHNSGDDQHASTERIWDIILTHRIDKLDLPLMYGLATDDGHNYHEIPSRASEPGRGWIMVLSDALTPESLIAAMEQGRFYASSGVALDKVVSSAEGLDVEVRGEPGVEYTVEFIGTRSGYDPASEPVLDAKGNPIRTTQRYSDEIGRVLKTATGTSASYQFTPNDLYVRARVTSSQPHPNPSEPGELQRAWVQPLRGPAGK